MGKIVIELQNDALNSEFNVIKLLRKAYLIAKKLKVKEFEEWAKKELDGYKYSDKVPEYRLVRGEFKAWDPQYGWIPVVLTKNDAQLTNHAVLESISNLLNGYENSGKSILFAGEEMSAIFSQASNFNTKYALFVGKNQIYDIFEQIRNIVLEWTLILEENQIFGEESQFNQMEQDIAKTTSIINNYINNFYSSVTDTQIQQDTIESSQKKE